MADLVLTRSELEQLFAAVTAEITGLTRDGRDAQIRIAYAPDGQPAWKRTGDTIALSVNYSDNPYDKQRDTLYDTSGAEFAEEQVTYTRVVQVMWTIYGPNGFDIADKLRCRLLSPPANALMGDAQVYPLTEIAAPVRIPYNFEGQWWERTDLRAQFNVFTRREREIPYIESANIEIYDDHGLERVVAIEPEDT